MSRLRAVLLAPLIVAQARRVRAATPSLAPAQPRRGTGQPGATRLLVLGDSTAVGTGVEQMRDALAGQLAKRLPGSTEWRAVGANGATAGDVRRDHLTTGLAEPADLVIVLVGWNDTLHLRSGRRYGADLAAILVALRERNPAARIVVVGPPDFARFAALPRPLRGALGAHASGLARVARRTTVQAGAFFVAGFDGAEVSRDLFHPNAAGYAGIAARIAAELA